MEATLGRGGFIMSVPMGGNAHVRIPPAGGGAECGSMGPRMRSNAWQRGLRAPGKGAPRPPVSPPGEPVSTPRRSGRRHRDRSQEETWSSIAPRRSGSNFFKPAQLSLDSSAPTPPRAPRELSHRPGLSAGTPCRRPPRLGSSFLSPRSSREAGVSSSARESRRHTMVTDVPRLATVRRDNSDDQRLWQTMRTMRNEKQRESELAAYRFAFMLIDTDHSDSVEAAEVLVLLKNMGKSVTVETGFWAAFNELDKDGNNSLDFEEFTEVLDRIRGNQTAEKLARLERGDAKAPNGEDEEEELAGAAVMPPRFPPLHSQTNSGLSQTPSKFPEADDVNSRCATDPPRRIWSRML